MGYFDCEYNALGRDKAGVLVKCEGSEVIGMLNGPFEPSGGILNMYSGSVRVIIMGGSKTRTQYASLQENIERILMDLIYLRDYPRCVLEIRIFVVSSIENILAAILNTISVLLINAGIQMKGILLAVHDSAAFSTSAYIYSNTKYQKVLRVGQPAKEDVAELADLLERITYSLKEDYKKDWQIALYK
ncbi:hypothetical protein NERG_00776 [Nematocida ausubeli]|uniref:Uncharacterized protein n=1 Tax=Nematocida ausubeli (strain ATCC PRA-371 / ERTm2) TaxID=1913371 RepID=H8ZB27_NEMA1|nr:hypothetical protein NERG_00776 [Nematocida ausubeli]